MTMAAKGHQHMQEKGHIAAPEEKKRIIQAAEQWSSRLYNTQARGFLNLMLSDPSSGRYIVDLTLEGMERWISVEVQMKQGIMLIPGGAVVTGRGSLAEIHRRFS